MMPNDRLWRLVANKLANEATEKELDELSGMLKQNQDLHEQVQLLYQWCDYRSQQAGQDDDHLFEKIKERVTK